MRTAMAEVDRLPPGADPAMAAASETGAFLKLLTFVSPAFPVGSFAYSHGLEWLIDAGRIGDAGGLQSWLTDILEVGGGWTDSVLFAEAYRAAAEGDNHRLRAAAELAGALAPSRERHLELVAQGRAFLAAALAAWPCRPAASLIAADAAPYPVAAAATAAGHGIAAAPALAAYLNAFATSLVSVGVRLVPLGQSAGLQIVAALHPVIAATAERALRSGLDDLGCATVLADVASMRHEVQYSRVFRT